MDDSNSPAALLYKLTEQVTGVTDGEITPYYQLALKIVGSNFTPLHEDNEFKIVEGVKKKFTRENKERDAVIFDGLCQKLRSITILKRRWAVLNLLANLQDSTINNNVLFSTAFTKMLSIPSLSIQPNKRHIDNVSPLNRLHHENSNTSKLPSLFMPAVGNDDKSESQQTNKTIGGRVANLLSYWQPSENRNVIKRPAPDTVKSKGCINNVSNAVPDSVLIREVVFIFQGIEGKIISFDLSKDNFKIDPHCGISEPKRKLVLRLAELGWMFLRIKKYCDTHSKDRAQGLVGQSFVVALHQELMEFYRLLAVLEAQLHLDEEPGISPGQNGLTLRQLSVWTFDPMIRMKVIASLVDHCKGLKGGALASAIHSFLKHGDPIVRNIISRILAVVVTPIYAMLHQWILDGEVEDQFYEFFIASDPTVRNDRLWHDKYSIRKSMVPSFLTMNQAKKILSSGKSLNFLKQVCEDHTPPRGLQAIQATLKATSVEHLFNGDHDSELHTIIGAAYKETSLHVLEVMHVKYKLMDHLKALRRYLLLGQGDFIRHLMNLLESDLEKPASSVYRHTLLGILETAVRATNAQFDDPDMLKRLDVRLIEASPGECGWDVFTLEYHVDGPIGTVFTPPVIMIYLRLFNSLWRAKRMEYVLAHVWKEQTACSRLFKHIPELHPVMHQCHMLTSEMVHFVQQMQYYITFEVMECSWDILVKKVKTAVDLDQVIAAHEEFLDTIMIRSLLDETSKDLLTQLRTIYELIIQFKNIQENFFSAVGAEIALREEFEHRVKVNTEQGLWGVSAAEDQVEKKRRITFLKSTVTSTRAQLRILAQSYQSMIQQFLLSLTSHCDVNLQFLSFRLDFNEHYKNRDARLVTSLTYQHRRYSGLGAYM